MDKTWTKPRHNLDIDIDNDIDKDINIMSNDIIFFELCPTEHNPRSEGATRLVEDLGLGHWELGVWTGSVSNGIELGGASLRNWDLPYWVLGIWVVL